tara:strand:- start:3879 stop:4097 length:219 start_codon:yes stop_codon:yes gene_type:complete
MSFLEMLETISIYVMILSLRVGTTEKLLPMWKQTFYISGGVSILLFIIRRCVGDRVVMADINTKRMKGKRLK